jgi:hypothetical protein
MTLTLFPESPPKSDCMRLGTLSVHPNVLKSLTASSFLRYGRNAAKFEKRPTSKQNA